MLGLQQQRGRGRLDLEKYEPEASGAILESIRKRSDLYGRGFFAGIFISMRHGMNRGNCSMYDPQ